MNIQNVVLFFIHQAHPNLVAVTDPDKTAFISTLVKANGSLGHLDGTNDTAGLPIK